MFGRHLLDVRCTLLDDARSFRFDFEFAENPFFEDKVELYGINRGGKD